VSEWARVGEILERMAVDGLHPSLDARIVKEEDLQWVAWRLCYRPNRRLEMFEADDPLEAAEHVHAKLYGGASEQE
jgi:hypothetical protein